MPAWFSTVFTPATVNITDANPVTAQPLQQVQRAGPGEHFGRHSRPRDGLALACDGELRHDGDQPQAGLGGQGLGEATDYVWRPQVLVF